MTRDEVELGRPIEDGDPSRDAIHIAVIAVTPVEDLPPGTHVKRVPDTQDGVQRDDVESIGVIDPFLPHPARKGQRCWMLLHPRTITSLRHVWSHPGFEDE